MSKPTSTGKSTKAKTKKNATEPVLYEPTIEGITQDGEATDVVVGDETPLDTATGSGNELPYDAFDTFSASQPETASPTDEDSVESPVEALADSSEAAPPTPTETAPADHPDAAQLRAKIEETRAEMSQTIDALQEKLDPQHIKEQVIEKVHDATVGQAQHLAETVGEKLSPATEKLEDVGHKLGEIAEPVVETARQKGDEFVRLVRRYPLPAAGIAMAALVLGWFMFPHDD